MIKLLQELCGAYGTSGDETDVRELIMAQLKEVDCEMKTDRLGNLIVHKKGRQKPKNRVMIAAHMDEVGFIVNYITAEGFLKISAVGGIMPAAVIGRQVRFKSGLIGVVGAKPIHKLKSEEKDAQPKIDALYVDIGAKNKDEAEQQVSLGDNCYFVSEFFEFGDGFVAGRAIDDRLGCAIMIEMIKGELEYDTDFAFTAAEEVGTRGAQAATYTIMPDCAIVLEATTACDIAQVEGGDRVCELGGGTVVSFMDNGTIYDKKMYDLAFSTAKQNNLKCQTKTKVAGGNDSSIIHKSLSGVQTVALSAPCRYLHTAQCVVKTDDCMEMRILAEKMAEKMAVGG